MVRKLPNEQKQYVVVDNQASSMQFIKCGVPQGSVLGPVLFLLFINYICNVSNLVKFVLFSDDTNIFYSNENVEVLQDTLNRELAKLFVWFSINKLSLNVGNQIICCFEADHPTLNYILMNSSVTESPFAQLLRPLNLKMHAVLSGKTTLL